MLSMHIRQQILLGIGHCLRSHIRGWGSGDAICFCTACKLSQPHLAGVDGERGDCICDVNHAASPACRGHGFVYSSFWTLLPFAPLQVRSEAHGQRLLKSFLLLSPSSTSTPKLCNSLAIPPPIGSFQSFSRSSLFKSVLSPCPLAGLWHSGFASNGSKSSGEFPSRCSCKPAPA